MTITISILMLMLGGGVAWITLNKDICLRIPALARRHREPAFEELPPDAEPSDLAVEETERQVGRGWLWTASGVLGLVCATCTWLALSGGEDTINLFRRFIAMLCLIGGGCVDFREERIPNLFPIVLSLSGILLLILGYVTGQEGAVAYLVSSGLAAGGCAIAMGIIVFLTRGGIGAGDIKLLCSLGLLCGIDLLGTVFFAIVPCALVSAILLLTKKKNKNGSLPFGPFILAGYIITSFVSLV